VVLFELAPLFPSSLGVDCRLPNQKSAITCTPLKAKT